MGAPVASIRDTRAALLERLANVRFDVLVVGGGITGTGVARDAALRGLSTALVEREDFASGTSSRSSRLVHGGVRYLEHGHLHLVFESSRERRTLLRIAPHLVRPLAFTWPVYRGARLPRWKIGAGLALYDTLALFRNVAPHRRLDAAGVLAQEPRLRPDGLLGGATYFDAETDDARLTLATALAAAEAGASVANHVEVLELAYDSHRGVARGALVREQESGREIAVEARVVVNATGPWSDQLRGADGRKAPAVRGTKGVHVAVPRQRVANRGAVTVVSPVDGRVMFVLPAGPHTIIGTTDTPTAVSPADVRASAADIAYLLESVTAFFPQAGLTREDVVSSWAGIRPLVASGYPTTAASASREHEITRSAAGVITVTGGKLTTYRAMAAEVVDAVERALGQRTARPTTARLPLPGGGGSYESVLADAVARIGRADVAELLVRSYGDRWAGVWALTEREPALADRIVEGLPYIFAQCVHAVEREMARTLGDILIRRTHVAFETRDHGTAVAPFVARVLAPVLGWQPPEVERQLGAYAAESRRIFAIDDG